MFDLSVTPKAPKKNTNINTDPFGIMQEPVFKPEKRLVPPILPMPAHEPLKPKESLSSSLRAGIADSVIAGNIAKQVGNLNLNLQANVQSNQDFEPQTLKGKAAYLAGNLIGDAPLFYAGELAAGKILAPLAKTKPIQAVASKLPKPLVPIIGGGINDVAAYGSVVAPAQTISNDGFQGLINPDNIKQTAKELPAIALGGMALRGVGAGVSKGLDVRATNKLNKQVDSLIPELPSNPLQDVQNAYKTPSLRDIKQMEYEQIFKNVDAPSTPNNTIRAENPAEYFGKQTQEGLESVFGGPVKQYQFTSGKQKMYEDIFSRPQANNPAQYFGKKSLDDMESVFGNPINKYSYVPSKYRNLFPTDEAYSSASREAAKANATPELRFGNQTQSDVEAAFTPRKVSTHKFVTSEQKALEEYNQGVQAAQNYVGHNDVLSAYPPGTTIEQAYADIKANIGVDIPKLTENLLAAQSKAKSLSQEQRRLGKVAGVLPGLKQRKTPMSTSQPNPLVPQLSSPKVDLSKVTLAPRDVTNSRIGKPYPFDLRTTKISETSKPNVGLIPTVKQGSERILPPPKTIEVYKPEPRQWTNAEQIKNQNQFPLVPKLEKVAPEHPVKPVAAVMDKTSTEIAETAKKIEADFTKIKDISGFEGNTKDIYRILEKTLGKDYADNFLKEFDSAKGSYIDMQNAILTDMKSNIVDKLGIKKGSKESELVQKFGEKIISEDELKRLSPKKWQNIVEADKWFRQTYDDLIDQINDVKRQIYPNAEANLAKIETKLKEVRADKSIPGAEKQGMITSLENDLEHAMRGKFIPKRSDYYRHFQELSEGLSGLKNIFDSPINIDPQIVGKTPFLKPKSKWASIAQRRLGGQTEYDAVGGFLNYLPQASYAVHIDPQISRFRGLADEIADMTGQTRNANNLIEFLQDFSNDLAGKTNSFDRNFQKMIPGGRTTVKAMDWLQNRIKSNMILGNFSSAVSQVANVPNGMAFAKQHSAKGAAKTIQSLFKPSAEMQKSTFLKERWGGVGSKIYRQFDESLLKKPKEAAVWMLETADKIGTQFVWNSAYAKGVAEKVADPIRYADDATRKLVAGRGVGEVPLIFKSKTFGWVAPFQLEVGNLWHVQKDMLSNKDFTGLAVLYTAMFAFNRLAEEVKGFGVTFDPIQAVIDASQEGLTPIERGGRIAGEVFSNIPLGQNIAKAAIPEYGGDVTMPWGKTYDLPSRKELFGENDPTRFGSGFLPFDALRDQESLAKSLILPFGGNQLAKTYKGAKALINEGVYSDDGKQLSYPVAKTLPNFMKGAMFGTSGFPESKDYYSQNRRPLTEKQTQEVDSSSDRLKAYEELMLQRKLKALEKAMKEATK